MVDQMFVKVRPGNRLQGQLIVGNRVMRCALGRSGLGVVKREGDGKTPIGTYDLLSIYLRRDGLMPRHHALPTHFIDEQD